MSRSVEMPEATYKSIEKTMESLYREKQRASFLFSSTLTHSCENFGAFCVAGKKPRPPSLGLVVDEHFRRRRSHSSALLATAVALRRIVVVVVVVVVVVTPPCLSLFLVLALSKMCLARVIALTACLAAVRCVTTKNENLLTSSSIIDYLRNYGYLTDDDVDALPAQRQNAVLRGAVERFQKYYGLPVDGTLNKKTLQLMHTPRCGFRDIDGHHEMNAFRFKWPKTHLKWDFYMASEDDLNTARAAFDVWSQHSALTFERARSNPDIVISWRRLGHSNTNVAKNGHNCTTDFDGPGGVLAHASLPNGASKFVSEVHVDGDETWHIVVGINPTETFSLHLTLTHEIGHSLGLFHNERRSSMMFAFMPEKQYPVELDQEDILTIQSLYGERVENDPPRVPTPPPQPPALPTYPPTSPSPSSPDLCALRRVDAVLVLEKRIYVSYKSYIWSIDIEGRTYNGPIALSNYLNFLQENNTRISAAYETPSGDIALFADNKVYMVKYPEFTLLPNWPRTLQEIGLPAKATINGAVNTVRGRSFVLFNGNSVGEIDECSKKIVKFTPAEVTFPGIPAGVRSIYRYIDGSLYFTTRRHYFKYNEFTKLVTGAGKFDLRILNVVCPKTELLQDLRDLLERIVRADNSMSPLSESYDDDED